MTAWTRPGTAGDSASLNRADSDPVPRGHSAMLATDGWGMAVLILASFTKSILVTRGLFYSYPASGQMPGPKISIRNNSERSFAIRSIRFALRPLLHSSIQQQKSADCPSLSVPLLIPPSRLTQAFQVQCYKCPIL